MDIAKSKFHLHGINYGEQCVPKSCYTSKKRRSCWSFNGATTDC